MARRIHLFVCLALLWSAGLDYSHIAVGFEDTNQSLNLCLAAVSEEMNREIARFSGDSREYTVQLANITTSSTCFCEDAGEPVAGFGCSSSDVIHKCNPPTRVCVWDCWSGVEVMNSTTVCLTPSNKTVAQALLALLEFFGWRQAIVFTDLSTPNETIAEFFRHPNVTVNSTSVAADTFNRLEEMDNSYRIFFLVHTGIKDAMKILCAAHKQRLFYPGHAWISVGVDVDELINTSSDMLPVNCTLDMIMTVLNYSLAIEPPSTRNAPSTRSSVLRDAITAVFEAAGNGESNTEVGIVSIILPSIVQQSILSVSFSGLTGIVSFDETGGRSGTVALVVQYRMTSALKKHAVALIEKSRMRNYTILYVNNENESTLWPDGVPPDGRPIRVLDATHIATFSVFVALFAVLLLLCIVCWVFNIIFRKRRVVKLTSPALNNVMVLGVILLGAGCVFYSTPIYSIGVLIPICILRGASVIFGHDIAFGIALMKLVRIHHIFRKPSPQKKPIKDWHLFLGLGAILAIEAVVFTVLQSVAFTVTLSYGEDRNSERPVTINENGIREEHYILVCGNPLSDYFLVGLTILVKFVMHTAAIVLAVRTRKVKVEAVNDAREIQITVCISTVLIILVGILLLPLANYPNVVGVGVGICIYLECITFLGFIFIPKMVLLWKDPTGKHVFDNTNPTKQSLQEQVARGKLRLVSITKVTNTHIMLQTESMAGNDDNAGNGSTDTATQPTANDTHVTESPSQAAASNGVSAVVQPTSPHNSTDGTTTLPV